MVGSLKELIDEPELNHALDPEEKFVSSDVSWENYEALLVKLENNSHYRVTYLDGVLEIVSPSRKHETIKTRLAFLVEFYLFKKQIKHTPLGSTRLKNRFKKAGAEPDECYCIGEEKDIPDLAIEVVVTSGNVKKLETYQRLGVREVWFWESDRLKLYHLREEISLVFKDTYGYEQIDISELLPELNISHLEKCTLISDQLQAISEFEASIS
jgi:Uma2 family endonuclease